MKRGAIVTVAASGYAGKPRPAVIIQSDAFDATDSVTVCLLTSTAVDAPLIRLLVEPGLTNGLQQPSYLMVDKIVTVRRNQIAQTIGELTAQDMVRLNRAILVFLGLAG
ncbi:MAG TPA: type II toxin-antitoxin system PemK/MazF family toxin [Pedomonas sp.]|uniref:type II toxin-antitoxin system PemK/MazF family toxin n=1 Tax=Pedomonas sp. TaxID=2976421 RepID=UPI002F40C5B9